MLEFHLGSSDMIVVTLNELQTIGQPYYLFVFEHITTKQIVSFVIHSTDDQSGFTYRYNMFPIYTSTIFSGKAPGHWNYTVYEQTNPSNTNPALAIGILEYGKMILYKIDEFELPKYNEPVTYQAYNG